MRVAVFSECYRPVANGVVTSIDTLRDTLRERGHTVFVFAPGSPQPDDRDVFRLPEFPFPQHPFHLARPFPRLPLDFGRLGVDVVHCQHPFTVGRLGAETAHRYGLPMVYTAHSLYDAMMGNSKSSLMRRVGRPAARGYVRRFCAKADAVIVPSRHTRDALLNARVRAHFARVPTGVPPLIASECGRERMRRRLGLRDETPLLLYVGRLGPEKHVELLLYVLAALREREPSAPYNAPHLAIVGDGQRRVPLEELAGELNLRDRVTFTGVQPHEDIPDWYAAADLFTLASPSETQGLVLIEAMQMHLPCVAIDQGGPTEIIADGRTGRLVPFGVQPFADAVEGLLRDGALRRAIGEAGYQSAQIYTPDAMAQGVLDVYDKVLSGQWRVIKEEKPRRLPRPPLTKRRR